MTTDDYKCTKLCKKGQSIVRDLMDDSDILHSMYLIFVTLEQCRKCCTFCEQVNKKNN